MLHVLKDVNAQSFDVGSIGHCVCFFSFLVLCTLVLKVQIPNVKNPSKRFQLVKSKGNGENDFKNNTKNGQ
jgi:hypothetical protein